MRPIFDITVQGTNLTELLKSRNASIRLTDQAGVSNDSLSISFDAGDGRNTPFTELPSKGVEIELGLGYEEGQNLDAPYPLTSMGLFKLTETKLRGVPYTINMFATSVDTARSFKMAVNGSYHNVTIEDIVKDAATASGYDVKINNTVGKKYIRHFDQRGLSNMAMLKRLAIANGCDMKVIDDKTLLFGPHGTLSSLMGGIGKQYNVFELREGMCSDWEYTGQSRPVYKKVRAKYYNKDKGESDNVEVEVSSASDKAEATYELSRAYPSKAEAQAAAEGKSAGLSKSEQTFTFTVAGCPYLRADSILNMREWYPGVPKKWSVVSAIHSFDKNGYITSCECEIYRASAI